MMVTGPEDVPSNLAMTENCAHECVNLETLMSVRDPANYTNSIRHKRDIYRNRSRTYRCDLVEDPLAGGLAGGALIIPVVEGRQRRQV